VEDQRCGPARLLPFLVSGRSVTVLRSTAGACMPWTPITAELMRDSLL
jgi:hypothetical protein